MALVPKSTLQTAVGLLVIGIAMVVALLVFAFSVLNNDGNLNQPGQSAITPVPSPTPEIDYRPIPEESNNF